MSVSMIIALGVTWALSTLIGAVVGGIWSYAHIQVIEEEMLARLGDVEPSE